jgi:hypothetical protein
MKAVMYYLGIMLLALLALLILILSGVLPPWLIAHATIIKCSLIGGFGAISYCLLAVYYHYCRKGDWKEKWIPWYYIKPVLGMIIGGFTYFFVAAGLLVLEATAEAEPSQLGVFVLSFIAGLNTDQFIAKIENIVSNLWGIKPSSLSRSLLDKEDNQQQG